MRALSLALIQLSQQNTQNDWRIARRDVLADKQSNVDEIHQAFEDAEKERTADPDSITVLSWWARRNTWVQGDFLGPHKKTQKLPEQCGGCYWTNDRDQEKTADAMVIDNVRFITSKPDADTDGSYHRTRPDIAGRNNDQYWIFWAREAASKSAETGLRKMEGLYDQSFNLTTSYRRDSDIPRPFGTAEKSLLDARFMMVTEENEETGEITTRYEEVQTGDENIQSIMDWKDNEGPYATWMVSNCDETRGAQIRFQYVQRMIDAGLKLDGFGACFGEDKQIFGEPWNKKIHDQEGKKMIVPGQMAKYKFYMAFENSVHCTDYISEKLWRNSLAQGLVPVVYGPHVDDVKAMAPPNSYIHVEDYNSPAELAKYLDYLSKNDTAYLEYHQWRKEEPKTLDEYVPGSPDLGMKCGICQELRRRRSAGNPRKMYKSVANWWWVNQPDSECTSGQMLTDWVTDMETVTKDNTYDELTTKDLKEKNEEKESQETTTIEWTTESTTESPTTQATNKENPRVQPPIRKHPQTYVWEPKASNNDTTVTISTTESPKTETEAKPTEKPHRGGIFKKENILKFGLPRPTTGPRRGGLFKKNNRL